MHEFDFAPESMKRENEQIHYAKETSFVHDAMKRFFAMKSSVVGLVLIAIIVLFAIFAPMKAFTSHRYDVGYIEQQSLPPRVPGLEKIGIFDGKRKDSFPYDEVKVKDDDPEREDKLAHDKYFYFGTDTLGRDLWTRTWKGARVSLYMALVAVVVDMVIGLSYGIISGYFGGKTDLIMQRIIEILNSIPNMIIVTLLVFVLSPGILSITLAIVIKGWIGMSRMARAQVLRLKEQEFILASRTLGSGDFKIIMKEILPNIFGQVIIISMFSIPDAIFTESFLAFIGLGLRAPLASLGVLISEGYKSFLVNPYMVLIPTTILAILMLSFTVVADGLRDAFDPKMKEV